MSDNNFFTISGAGDVLASLVGNGRDKRRERVGRKGRFRRRKIIDNLESRK
jgi:hypothetical protein